MTLLTVVVGTRPECIKMSLVVAKCKELGIPHQVVHTGQHQELWYNTGLKPDLFVAAELTGVHPDLDAIRVRDSLIPVLDGPVVVQGDTLSAYGGALAGRQSGFPVYHVEAGVRSGNLEHPWPEEGFRMAIDHMSDLGFCNTDGHLANLRAEGRQFPAYVTGSPGIDALRARQGYVNARLDKVIITLHRRESHGQPMIDIVEGLLRVCETCPETIFDWPVHPNPAIQVAIPKIRPENLRIGPPMHYGTFLNVLAHSSAVLTDSGGVQEDAAALGVPCAVARDVTDRPESLESGHAVMAYRSADSVETALHKCLGGHVRTDPSDVFGDGHAAERIAEVLAERVV